MASVRSLIILLIIVSAVRSLAQIYTVESVPNVKLQNNSYVSNPDGIITPESVSRIDATLGALEDSTTVQVAVVLLNSIGDAEITEFAQNLFELWRPGVKGKDNGVLILLVMDQRTVRFHTGFGVESTLPDAVCKKIQRERMVPYFKDGNYDQGMVEGVSAVASRFLGVQADEDFESASQSDWSLMDITFWVMAAWALFSLIILIVKIASKAFAKKEESGPALRYSALGWILLFVVAPVAVMFFLTSTESGLVFSIGTYGLIGSLYLVRYARITGQTSKWLNAKQYQALYNFYQQYQGGFSALRFFFPIPFAFLYGTFKRKMQSFRDHPRDCTQCGKPLKKLGEKEDDKFLEKRHILEEVLQSVDYDVWKCSACNAAEKLAYLNPGSKYSSCPQCQTRAYYLKSDRTITSATTSSEGSGEKIYHCKYCNHNKVERYTIARIQESSSSSSSGGSSGGSWGGGSSGGGGASSSW